MPGFVNSKGNSPQHELNHRGRLKSLPSGRQFPRMLKQRCPTSIGYGQCGNMHELRIRLTGKADHLAESFSLQGIWNHEPKKIRSDLQLSPPEWKMNYQPPISMQSLEVSPNAKVRKSVMPR